VLAKVVAEAKDPASVMLEDIMSTELVSIKASEAISFLAQFMSEKGVRRVLVLDKGTLIGVVTSKDVLAKLTDYVNKISSQISRLQAPWF
jgi:predicted transcriptional regulator